MMLSRIFLTFKVAVRDLFQGLLVIASRPLKGRAAEEGD
ncbi:MAG: hypothetical protein ACI8T1_003934 [Verrucomicrobiales bacterium]|jgi:hypothetical protein